jgi:hypothetical protein
MCAPKDGEAKSELFEQRMAMVRHLVDVVGCDVNVVATWAGKWCSTPLCHFANRDDGRDKRELISFLLERGADPDLAGTIVDENTNLKLPSAIECAQSGSNTRFVEAVRELQAEKRGGAVGATWDMKLMLRQGKELVWRHWDPCSRPVSEGWEYFTNEKKLHRSSDR